MCSSLRYILVLIRPLLNGQIWMILAASERYTDSLDKEPVMLRILPCSEVLCLKISGRMSRIASSRNLKLCNFWSRVQSDLQPNSETLFEHVSSQTSCPNCLDNAHEKRVRRRRRGRGKYLIYPSARFSLMHQQLA